MRIEEVIGRRIRDRREGQEMTQEQLGQQLAPLLGREWSRQAVSIAERGGRALTAAELIAIAHVLGTNVGRMFTPPLGTDAIELPGDVTLSREEAVSAVLPLTSGGILDEMRRIVDALKRDLRFVYEGAELAATDMQALDRLLELASENATLSPSDRELATEGVAELTRVSRSTGEVTKYNPDSGEWVKQPQPTVASQRGESDTRPPIVAAIVTSPLGVLVGRRVDGKPPWTFIAGEQDAVKDENPADTAVREVKEETGLRIQAGEIIGERVHPKTGRTMIYIAATPTHGTDYIVGDEDELAEVRWVGLAEADELLPGMYEPVREHLARELRDRGEF